MELTSYKLIINSRTPEGYVETARFYAGDSEQNAINIYGRLLGSPTGIQLAMLRLDLVMMEGDSCSIVATMDCTLDDVADNTKTIIKETFRILNLI